MVVLQCPIANCGFATQDVEIAGASVILNIHATIHTPAAAPAAPAARSRGPKLIRPKIKLNGSNEEWNAFIRRWNTFRIGSNIDDASAPGQLLECTTEELGDIVLRAYPDFTERGLDQSTAILKSHVD